MKRDLHIFIGYDPKEAIAYHVLSQSIMRHAKRPVRITPLCTDNLGGLYSRHYENQSTDFSFTRFLVPHLSSYGGWSLYMDCDMLARADVNELLNFVDANAFRHDVLVCKHDYTPKRTTKFLGNRQTAYERKNWASLMLFNNSRCADLRPEYVNTAKASDLHQMEWAGSIGELPLEWNWLVGEYEYKADAKLVHFTNGIPCFSGYRDCDYADEWFNERRITLAGGNE